MKKTFTIALLFCFCGINAQNLPNSFLNNYETINCPFDSTVSIDAFQDWLIYQTLDGTWDGPIDSSSCIGLAANNLEGISLQGANLELPIFVKAKFTDSTKILLYPNQLYTAVAYVNIFDNDVEMVGGIDCPESICSGLIVGIEIPDSTGASTAMRWYTDVPDISTVRGVFETCVPTEYFTESYLREFIIKMTPGPETAHDQKIVLTYTYFAAPYDINYITEIVASESTFVDTSYQVALYQVSDFPSGWWSPNYLLLYTDLSSWPSSTHPSYVEGRPEINTSEPKIINLTVDAYETFVPQPFAQIRGALVEGSDSVRHQVNLINHEGDICMSGPIDLVFGNTSKYVHQGGNVNFENRSACMMFQNGGELEVAKNTRFRYGQGGKGILVLRPGSTIRLRKGSTLSLDNLLWLQGLPTPEFPDHQLYMELNPGTTLEFGEHANIINHFSKNGDTKLNIYMNGGTLDDSRLSAEARSLIHKIYPNPKPRFSENVSLLKNPVDQGFELSYYAGKALPVNVELFGLSGKRIGAKIFQAIEGNNKFQYDMNGIAAGIYIVSVRSSEGRASLKVVKVEQ